MKVFLTLQIMNLADSFCSKENDMESMILLPQPHYYNNNSVLFLHRPLAEELSVIPGKINLHDEQVTMEVIV